LQSEWYRDSIDCKGVSEDLQRANDDGAPRRAPVVELVQLEDRGLRENLSVT
jgi:hypothetical protein